MVYLSALWLPILLSAVLVFVTSSIIHMVLKFHRSDYAQMPGEEEVRAAMRQGGVEPGHYYMPYCVDMKEMANPEVKKRFEEGPVAFVTVLESGLPKMAKPMLFWFLHALVISLFAAYLASRTQPAGADYLEVFRITGTAALLGYSGSCASESIWKGLPWRISFKHIFDGLIYALLTAGVFGWLWPAA